MPVYPGAPKCVPEPNNSTIHRPRRRTDAPSAPVRCRTGSNRIFTPYVTITARQLLNEIIHRVVVLSGDIERSFNILWDPFDDIQLDSDSRTELLIINEADPAETCDSEQPRDFSMTAAWA